MVFTSTYLVGFKNCTSICQAMRTFQECLMALEGIMVAEGMKHEGGREGLLWFQLLNWTDSSVPARLEWKWADICKWPEDAWRVLVPVDSVRLASRSRRVQRLHGYGTVAKLSHALFPLQNPALRMLATPLPVQISASVSSYAYVWSKIIDSKIHEQKTHGIQILRDGVHSHFALAFQFLLGAIVNSTLFN